MLFRKTLLGALTILFTLSAAAFSFGNGEAQLAELTGLRVGPSAPPLSRPLLRAFSSDGCSLSPNGVPFGDMEWVDCCMNHDIKYWIGGTTEDRQAADADLKQCIASKGYPKVAVMYFLGVRLGGIPGSHTTFRWGYGWTPARPYSPLTREEISQAEFFYGKDVSKLRKIVSQHQVKAEFKLNVYDSSMKGTDSAEVSIYQHLRALLKEDQIVVKATTVAITRSEKLYLIYLNKCPATPLEYLASADQSIVFRERSLESCRMN